MDDSDNSSRSNGGPRKRRKSRSGYGDRSYRVGKGKPPVEHQFRKGGPSPNPRGRPKGSTRISPLEKLLRKKITVTDKNGRHVRKTICEVIDHKLVELAAGGDLKAIRQIKDIEFQFRREAMAGQPTAAEAERIMQEEAERRVLAERLTGRIRECFDLIAFMKKIGALRTSDGKLLLEKWVVDAAEAHGPSRWRPGRSRSGSSDGSQNPA